MGTTCGLPEQRLVIDPTIPGENEGLPIVYSSGLLPKVLFPIACVQPPPLPPPPPKTKLKYNYKGIDVKIIMSENDSADLRLFEAFYIKKCKPTLNSQEECTEFADLLF